jgi:hypothetical protein
VEKGGRLSTTLVGQVQNVAYLVICAFALWRGGTPERLAAATIFIANLAAIFGQDRVHFSDPQFRFLILDLTTLLTLLAITYRFPRTWLLLSVAAQILAIAMRAVAVSVQSIVHARAWLTMEILLGYVVLACLAVGTAVHSRSRDRFA